MRRGTLFGLLLSTALLVGGCSKDSNPPQIIGPGGTSGTQTLLDVTTGLEVNSGQTGTFNWVGQSFVVPATGSFRDLRFNFYNFQKEPVAFGNLYLLTQEYLGLPGTLSVSASGFVARSDSTANGVYTFGSSVAITGGTKYWVYTDAQGSFAGSFDTDIYTGGDMYVSGFPSSPFRKAQASGRTVNGVLVPAPAGVFVDANFRLQARGR